MRNVLFFTGTDTGVGKTYVAAWAARALRASGVRVGVYKPIASGCRRSAGRLFCEDAAVLWEAAGRPGELDQVAPQRFEAPLAPHLAARAEGQRVNDPLLLEGIEVWLRRSEIVLVEGAGGLMSPLSDQMYNADLAATLACPVVIVAPNVLGVINQTLQTLITAKACRGGLPVAGVVLNNALPTHDAADPSRATNAGELASRCSAPLLAEVPYGGVPDTPVDWLALSRRGTRESV